ncbi:hypothetical protein [Streptomyces sp. MA15]|uniref:hypothetical protein n=1 Tax=unclassified Streptomyces TaxID=2593676 RepID=UPI0025B26357|nr:hypothetical protein [Streptomyces sp. MA15]MDN3268635.1 hypothetical protein [Streptomyces sp. MA15]
MNTTQREALISMVAVLGLFVLMTAPAVIGILRDRRLDRQIRRAAATAAAEIPAPPAAARPAHGTSSRRTARAA